jgi:hypothetical protein
MWRPVKSGTRCGAKGDERQALGNFTSQLAKVYVQPVRNMSRSLKFGRPNAFVRGQSPVIKDWDALQRLHLWTAWTLAAPTPSCV